MSLDLTQYAYTGDVVALALKMKQVLASAINSLLPESSLDNSKSVIVSNFAFNSTTYPGATDPNLNGKPVLVLAVKTIDHTNNNTETIAYSFLNLAPLVVDISGKVDKLQGINPNNIPMFDANGNLLDSGLTKAVIEAHGTAIGQISSLSTNAKSSLVLAINELFSQRGGALSNLSTSDKSSIIAAINELVTSVSNSNTARGNLSSLTTSNKSSIVGAVNEIVTALKNASNARGILANLSTNAKSNLVAAINELVTNSGVLANLSTSAKTNLVTAINELWNERGGALSNLSTSDKSNIIAAINEITTKIERLTGRSAYEIACLHGYTGTEEQWVDYLRNGGGYTDLVNLTERLTYGSNAHNSYYRGKNLGNAVTPALIQKLRNNCEDWFIGDYFTFTIDGEAKAFVVAAFLGNRAVLWLRSYGTLKQLNSTDTCEGHLFNLKLYKEDFPDFLEQLHNFVPDEYMIDYEDDIADSIDANGNVNHRTYDSHAGKLYLPSATNCGLTFVSSSLMNKAVQNVVWRRLGSITWPIVHFIPAPHYTQWWLSSNENSALWHVGGFRVNAFFGTSTSAVNRFQPYIILG